MKKKNRGHGGGGGGQTFMALGLCTDGYYDADRVFHPLPVTFSKPLTLRESSAPERPALVSTLYGRDPEPVAATPCARVARGAIVLRAASTFALSVLAGLAILAAVAALSGCTPTAAYRSADRSRFEAIAPEVSAYWAADPKLDGEQKARRFRLLRAWDADSAGLDERQTRPPRN